MPAAFHAKTDAAGQRARCARGLVSDLMGRTFELEESDDAVVAVKAAFNVQRLPWTAFFEFRITGAILGRRAERGALDFARPQAAKVAQYQLDRTANCRIGAVAMAEHIDPRVHADPPANRAIHHDYR